MCVTGKLGRQVAATGRLARQRHDQPDAVQGSAARDEVIGDVFDFLRVDVLRRLESLCGDDREHRTMTRGLTEAMEDVVDGAVHRVRARAEELPRATLIMAARSVVGCTRTWGVLEVTNVRLVPGIEGFEEGRDRRANLADRLADGLARIDHQHDAQRPGGEAWPTSPRVPRRLP